MRCAAILWIAARWRLKVEVKAQICGFDWFAFLTVLTLSAPDLSAWPTSAATAVSIAPRAGWLRRRRGAGVACGGCRCMRNWHAWPGVITGRPGRLNCPGCRRWSHQVFGLMCSWNSTSAPCRWQPEWRD